MRVALGPCLLFACLALVGCKRSSPTDLSSPEATLNSFFKAIEESRIPSELNAFVLDGPSQASWRHRCKSRGCKKVKFEIVEVKERGESGAILLVDYIVFGNKDLVVMQGQRSPIRFERIGSNWGITQFGRHLGAPITPKPPTKTPNHKVPTTVDAAPVAHDASTNAP